MQELSQHHWGTIPLGSQLLGANNVGVVEWLHVQKLLNQMVVVGLLLQNWIQYQQCQYIKTKVTKNFAGRIINWGIKVVIRKVAAVVRNYDIY